MEEAKFLRKFLVCHGFQTGSSLCVESAWKWRNDIVLAGCSCEVLEHQQTHDPPATGSVWVASPVPVVQACGNQTHVDPTVPIRSMHLFYALETLNNQITCSKHTHIWLLRLHAICIYILYRWYITNIYTEARVGRSTQAFESPLRLRTSLGPTL